MIHPQHSPSHLLHRARQRADELLTRRLAVAGITPRQFTILYAISCDPGLNQSEITDRTGSDRSTIAELIVRLERTGFVQRTRSRKDARVQEVTLTERGLACVASCMPAVNAADDELLAAVPPERRPCFVEALVAITSAPEAF